MSTTEKYALAGSTVTLLSSELNSLATSSGPSGGAISGSSSSNVQGDGKGDGYTLLDLELHLGVPSGALDSGAAAYVWWLRNVANQESGGSSSIPARGPDVIIPLDPSSSAQTHTMPDVRAPTGTFFTLLAVVEATARTLAASGNTLIAQYKTRQGV